MLQTYAKAMSPVEPEQDQNAAIQYCQDNLLGVALLIMDEQLQRHEVTVDLYDAQQQKLGESRFRCEADHALFTIRDRAGNMPEAAQFHAFMPSVDKLALKADNWTLRLDKTSPQLMRMPMADSRNVYGLAHGDALAAIEQQQQWPSQLQAMLCGESGQQKPLKTTALLNGILARSLISAAVSETLDAEARLLRFKLQQETTKYAKLDNSIKDIPNHVLETQLRDMEHLVAETDYALGRVSQAIKTLEINHDNFDWRLNHWHSEKTDWQMDWQSDSKYPPLLERLHTDIALLKNHVAYIEGKLIHLKGACTRWRSYITEHRHLMTKHLGHVEILLFS